MTTIAELCAGYSGLAMALRLLDPTVDLAWVAETDPSASSVLKHHHPDVPNYGDITKPLGLPMGLPRRHLDAPRRARQKAKRSSIRISAWKDMADRVDVLAGGFPCQPFSMSGKRRGSNDSRHLWPTGMMPTIRALEPPVVLLENVEGLRTIQKGEVFRTILGDLMTAGYTVRWATLGACKLGLCHHRHRMFILATHAVGELPLELGMPLAAWSSWTRDGIASGGDVWEHESSPCGTTGITLPTPTARDSIRGAGRTYAEGRPLSEVVALLPTPTTMDGSAGIGAGRRRDGRDGVPNLRTAVTLLLPTPLAGRDERGIPGSESAQARMASGRRMLDDAVALLPTPTATPYGNNQSPSTGAAVRPSLEGVAQSDQWGRYAAAIARHELVVGRPAPYPTIAGKRGGRRLNPQLTEWMMGLPDGWITRPLGGDPNAANRVAGNGVIPLVAAAAIRLMCGRAGFRVDGSIRS